MKKLVATEREKEKLKYYASILNDRSLPLYRRRWGKMHFDMLYKEIKNKNDNMRF